MFKSLKPSVYLTIASLALMAISFQNCSKANFNADSLQDANLKTEAVSEDVGDDVSTRDPGEDENLQMPPADKKNDESSDKKNADLVECQILHPNSKVVLDLALKQQHGNSSSVRVCMSTNACLEIVNAYAAEHSCSLEAGAATSQDSGQQCSEIFPGSKGTCHNATVLSDQQVTDLLKKLAEKK